jgi:glycosyltransferase involved in cell wall biosynthesis
MKILLLNQYGPGSGAPTGRILGELSTGLRELGHETVLLEATSSYGVSRRGLSRILHEGQAHAALLFSSLAQGRINAVISLTSPACLAVTAAFISRLKGARHFHWAMDIYPDVGVQLGELPQGAVTRLLAVLMRRAYRHAARVIALDEDMREFLKQNYGVDSDVLEPFPPEVTWRETPRDAAAPRRWCYSGNFGRAHEIDVLLLAQRRLEDRGVKAVLVLQGKGAQFLSSQEAARRLGLNRVEWRPPAPEENLGESLLSVDALVVTRKASMKGLLLPSKLMLARLSGRPILWIGDTDSSTARLLQKEGHGVFAFDQPDAIADWLQKLFEDNLPIRASRPEPSKSCRERAVAWWNRLLNTCV